MHDQVKEAIIFSVIVLPKDNCKAESQGCVSICHELASCSGFRPSRVANVDYETKGRDALLFVAITRSSLTMCPRGTLPEMTGSANWVKLNPANNNESDILRQPMAKM